jgi:N-acetylglutamate synthase-like GNAT family acetyltransferase
MSALRAHPVAGSDGGLKEALVAASLPIDDITEGGRRFFRFDRDGTVVGYGGFEPLGSYALLRSLVVLPEARGQGNGRAVTEAVAEKAREAGCSEAYLLTATATEFFEHLGFERMARVDAPQTILATRQASSICSSAAVLTRTLAQ